MAVTVALVVAALITSTISGILGMGGGVTLLGVMALLMAPALVVPLHGVVQLGSNATRTIAFAKHVRWSIVLWFTPALVVGLAAAAAIYTGSQLTWLKPFIGAYLIGFVIWRRHTPALRAPPLPAYAGLGLVAGFAALFVGATGPFLAPFFFRDDWEKEEVIATKAACQLLVHVAKLPAFFALGFPYLEHLPLLATLLVAVIIGTLIGKRVLAKMRTETFLKLFEIVLVLLGLLLLVRPVVRAFTN